MAKPREKRKTKARVEKKSGNSSSEDEHQKTENIINRLSHKYQKVITVPETEVKTRRRSPRIASKPLDPYEADLDTTDTQVESSSASDVPMSPDLYDFNEDEEMQTLNLVLSPPRKTNSKKSIKKKTGATNEGPNNGPSHLPAPNSKNANKRKITAGVEKENKTEPGSKKIKISNSISRQIMPVKGTGKQGKGKLSVSFSSDSGVFLSPSEPFRVSTVKSSTPLGAVPTSTPNQPPKKSELSVNDSCFGFSSATPSNIPAFSPVQKISLDLGISSMGSSMSSHLDSSPDHNSLLCLNQPRISPLHKKKEHTTASPVLFENAVGPTVKYSRCKKRRMQQKDSHAKDSNVDEWASNINSQFDDIEMHELSIEG